MNKWFHWIGGGFATVSFALYAQTPVDLTQLDRDMVGPRAQVLILGTMHLNAMPASFQPASLDGLLNRLAEFKPDIITIEAESGEECDLAARHPAKYGPDYCPSTKEAMMATGLDVPAAMAEVDKTLKAWPAKPTADQRRHMAALFLAANDRASAYVQWLQLPEVERRPSGNLNADLVQILKQIAMRKNENYLLAARLAARLGHTRVYATDNHTGDRIDVPDIKAFVNAIESAWSTGGEALKSKQARQASLMNDTDLLPVYRYLNDPQQLKLDAEINVSTAMRAKSPEAYPQMWVAGWEIRNLRMVANIRETFRERPGARVLSIVGATHKPWFDHWLGQLQGVEMVNVVEVLR